MREIIRRFLSCERGNIALLAAGAAVPLLAISVGGVELADRTGIRNNLQESSDIAVLSAFASGEKSWRKQQDTAKSLFYANLKGRERFVKIETRLKRQRKGGKQYMEHTAKVKFDSLFGSISAFGDGTISVSSLAVEVSKNSRNAKLVDSNSSERTVKTHY